MHTGAKRGGAPHRSPCIVASRPWTPRRCASFLHCTVPPPQPQLQSVNCDCRVIAGGLIYIVLVVTKLALKRYFERIAISSFPDEADAVQQLKQAHSTGLQTKQYTFSVSPKADAVQQLNGQHDPGGARQRQRAVESQAQRVGEDDKVQQPLDADALQQRALDVKRCVCVGWGAVNGGEGEGGVRGS